MAKNTKDPRELCPCCLDKEIESTMVYTGKYLLCDPPSKELKCPKCGFRDNQKTM